MNFAYKSLSLTVGAGLRSLHYIAVKSLNSSANYCYATICQTKRFRGILGGKLMTNDFMSGRISFPSEV